MPNYSFIFKYILIGDSGVGKSCIASQFLEKKFNATHQTTIGVEFGVKIVNVNEETIKLQIWDTTGQESFKSITRSYYRSAAGAILVFDITRKETFQNIEKWLEDAKTNGNETMTFILVGNKSDLEEQFVSHEFLFLNRREVQFDEASDFAEKNGILYVETSAKTGFNIALVKFRYSNFQVFQRSAEEIYYKIQNNQIDLLDENCGVKRPNADSLSLQSPETNVPPYENQSYCCY